MSLFYALAVLVPIVAATNLNQLYANDITLTVSGSPYYVVSDVDILDNVTMTIENGVEIAFMGDHTILVSGIIDACSNYNTYLITDKIGLSNSNIYTYIHGNYNVSNLGKISILSTSIKSTFCNVKFENMEYSIDNHYELDNCEILNMIYSSYDALSLYISTINDTYIANVSYINYYQGFVYDHCRWEHFGDFSPRTNGVRHAAVRNSEIYGNGTQQKCIDIYRPTGDITMVVYNNLIVNCLYGVYIWDTSYNQQLLISYNNITNCQQFGIYSGAEAVHVKHNIFSDNYGYDLFQFDADSAEIQYNEFINSLGPYSVYLSSPGRNYIYYNKWINNHNPNQISLYMKDAGDCRIQYNEFENNVATYSIYFYTSYAASYFWHNYVEYNKFIGNNLTMNAIYLDDIRLSWTKYNLFENNKIGDAIIKDIDGSYNEVENNTFINNEVKGPIYYHYCSNTCGASIYYQATFSYNTVSNNILKVKVNKTESNLLYFRDVGNMQIRHNEFNNNTNNIANSIYNMIYLTGTESNWGTTIQFNNFYDYSSSINSYINYYDTLSAVHNVKYNNFNSYQNVNYFIYINNTQSVNAQLNYYTTTNVSVIQQKMQDLCDDINANSGVIYWWPYYLSSIDVVNYNMSSKPNNATVSWSTICVGIPQPTYQPTSSPTTARPSIPPTSQPSNNPTSITVFPTKNPSTTPTNNPSGSPTSNPSSHPTGIPTETSISPSKYPTNNPTATTISPTNNPSNHPTDIPSKIPSSNPTTSEPTISPSEPPTNYPTDIPSKTPTSNPITAIPTDQPTSPTTSEPTTNIPTTNIPSGSPTSEPTMEPTMAPTQPTMIPTQPTMVPTQPTIVPTQPTSSTDAIVMNSTEKKTNETTTTMNDYTDNAFSAKYSMNLMFASWLMYTVYIFCAL